MDHAQLHRSHRAQTHGPPHAAQDCGELRRPSGCGRTADPWEWDRRDWLVAGLLAVVVSVGCLAIVSRIPPFLLQSMDLWFEADTLREVSNMTRVQDDHYRTSVHPLFSLITFVPVYLLKQGLGLDPLQAAVLLSALVAGLWAGALYALVRLIGCRRLDAFIFTLLGLASASSLFWLPIPNSYTWGSLSIMLTLLLVLYTERRPLGAAAYVVASAFSLSVTVTNWMAGLLMTLARWPWKQAVQLSVNALCVVVLLWGVQKIIFPTAEFFIGARGEESFINHPQAGGPLKVLSSFFFHSVVAPHVGLMEDDAYVKATDDSFRLPERLTFQFSRPGSAGLLSLFAVGLWSALFLIGGWRLVTSGRQLRFRQVLGGLLAFELVLHLLYGEETFTYSLNFVPLLLAVGALGTLGSGRRVVVALTGLLAVSVAVNNWQQFQTARDQAMQFTPQRHLMTDMMRQDPDRLWPRSVGHVPLAVPGAPEGGTAYHEPGGDFSPQLSSFGVSLWLCDDKGNPVVTSKTIPLHEIHQEFVPSARPQVPAIATQTPYYEATWSRLDATHWELRFTNRTHHVPAVVIRSVGPAGGPVTSLEWERGLVGINHRWSVRASPSPERVALGDENATGWMTTASSGRSWSGESGWGYARLTFSDKAAKIGEEIRVVVSDRLAPVERKAFYGPAPQPLQLTLPEPRFHASMQAQTAHLMMSLVDDETRPGDPVLFYRAWHRPGAYIASALARAGDPRVSRALSQFLGTHDFGGGAGPEADAPGLTIWALTEAAVYIADPVHDQWLWPHIVRKAGRIERMLTAQEPVVETYAVPSPHNFKHGQRTKTALVAQPARAGLIVGRVGEEWPTWYVNAVSYRGLLAAAQFADRLGKARQAVRWRTQAQALHESWERQQPTESIHAALAEILPMVAYRPPSDSSTIVGQLARAHEALRLEQPEAVWALLRRLWNRQASPGLYTWDAPRSNRQEIADGWQFARGWRNEAVVSPDYEAAALLLKLQQDMLAYVEEQGPDSTVVIGAGMVADWRSEPMAVSGLALPGGSIGWAWDGRRMRVTLRGPARTIRLGAAFPKDAEVSVLHESLTS